MSTTMTVPDMDEATYHASPALSATGVKEILKSPAHYRHMMDNPRPTRDAFDLGHAVHAAVLGVGLDVEEIPEELLGAGGAISTKAAKEFVAEARAAGRVPLKRDLIREVNRMTDAVLTHPLAGALLERDFAAEHSMFTTDPETEIDLRARFDYLGAEIVDLKTTQDASVKGFTRSVGNYGYHLQRAHYGHVLNLVEDRAPRFLFIAVETTAPYLVGVHTLDDHWEEIGYAEAHRARRIFAECARTGEWPGYPNTIGVLAPPVYIINEFQEQEHS